MEIKGKVALITGGGSGIGRATAMRLAAEGASIMVVDLNQRMADETVAAIGADSAAAVKADTTDAAQMSAAFDETIKRFGHLDILHNNAGIATGPPGFPQA